LPGFAVEFVNVEKHFPNPDGGDVNAVNQVSLQIYDGEFFSLLGPSGCGKTTSLRMIAGFEWPTRGKILIKGQSMGRTPPYLRPVNTVFQNYALFQHMTVFENVAFGLEMEHQTKQEIHRRVSDVLSMVQMSEMGARKPKQLSGGQQQRVALARALVKRPDVLLLDEPLGALDQKLRKEMQLELKNLQMQVGITFIYVTHDQEEALTMSDRIAVMNKGKVLQIGNPVEIYERPNCRFVADFIGESNFIKGTITESKGKFTCISLNGADLQVMGIAQEHLSDGQKAVVSLRPEKIRLLLDEPELEHNNFPVKVITTAYIGSDTRILVDLGNGITMTVWEQNRISNPDKHVGYRPGQELWAMWFADNALILPEEQ
jgi:spermidine/putrescine transport system ATP-binding protein